MSIANYSVVSRILAQVQATASPPELGEPERAEQAGQLFELRRSARVHEAPFATPFHFWAHALRDLLEARGRPDLFEAMATHALCKAEAGEGVRLALRELVARVGAADGFSGHARFEAGYRMIDQDVMASWVAEAAGELVAFFWLRADWLAEAAPYDPEPAEAAEDESAEA